MGHWAASAVDLDDAEVERLLRRVHPKTLTFVRAVVAAGGRAKPRDLYAQLGHSSPTAARGVLSGLTKRVRRIKGRGTRLFGWVSVGEGSHGILTLTPTTQAVLERYFELA